MKCELHATIFNDNVIVGNETFDSANPDFEVLLKYQPIDKLKIGFAYYYPSIQEYRYDSIITIKRFLELRNITGETPIERLRNKLTPYFTLTGIAAVSDIKFENEKEEKIFNDTLAICKINMAEVQKWLKLAEETKTFPSN